MAGKPRGVINKLVRQGAAKVKQCPVTCGCPTIMTQEAFALACEKCRQQDKYFGFKRLNTAKHTWCSTCQGLHLPSELRLISLKKLQAMRRKERQKNRPETAQTVRAHTTNPTKEGR